MRIFGEEAEIRLVLLRSLGRSRSRQPTGQLLCTARPSKPFLISANKKEQTPQGYLFFFMLRVLTDSMN